MGLTDEKCNLEYKDLGFYAVNCIKTSKERGINAAG
jgi:hypothetical protein